MGRVLSEEQVDFFYLNGYLKIPGLFPEDELKDAQRDSKEMIERGLEEEVMDPSYLYGEDGDGRKCLFRINDLLTRHKKYNSFKCLLAYPRLLKAISEAVRDDYFVSSVHSLVFKIPRRGYPVPWHQDPVTVFRYPVFNVDVYLDESSPENGCVYVLPKSHLGGYHDPKFVKALVQGKETDVRGALPVQTEPGDVIFHATSIVHGSFWNRSKDLRRTIYFHIDHLEDIVFAPLAPSKNSFKLDMYNKYLKYQEMTEEAWEIRKKKFPEEEPFPYRTLSKESFNSMGNIKSLH